MIILTIFDEECGAREFPLEKKLITIGRLKGNDIIISDKSISGKHLKLTFLHNDWTLEDLHSTNGTSVNGNFVEEKKLDDGDEIVIGKTRILFGEKSSFPHPKESSFTIIKAVMPSAVIPTSYETASNEELKRTHKILATLYKASELLSSALKLEDVLNKILDLIFQHISADRVLIILKDELTGKLVPKAVKKRDEKDRAELTVSHSIMSKVLDEGKSVICSDALEDKRFKEQMSIIQHQIHSAMCVPLKTKDRALGVIYADTLMIKGAFNTEDLNLLTALGNEAALAIDNVRLYEKNLEAERLAGIGQAITGMAHYVKNILVGMDGGGILVDMGIKQKNSILMNKGWKLVKASINKVRDVVMDMLTYSKERKPQLQPCNLNDVVDEIIELMSKKAEDVGIKLHAHLDKNIGQFLLDPQVIHRSLLNLINNAFDAMEKDGKITIATEYIVEGDQLKLSVSDTGSGIPEDVLTTLFTPFYSSKGLKGTGLGLAVTHKIIKEHGGRIDVNSEVGKGTTFNIFLPARKE
ncbi:MAG: ATP-binding protein [bacterium]|nr:ATP-binding protein [bacterium]